MRIFCSPTIYCRTWGRAIRPEWPGISGGYNRSDQSQRRLLVVAQRCASSGITGQMTKSHTRPASPTERQHWWTAYEAAGTNADFITLDWRRRPVEHRRTARAEQRPLRDGLNQVLGFGAGTSGADQPLASAGDNGSGPTESGWTYGRPPACVGQPNPAAFYHQFGTSTSATATVRFYWTRPHPYNSNAAQIYQAPISGTGTNNVGHTTLRGRSIQQPRCPEHTGFWQRDRRHHTRYLYAHKSWRSVRAGSRRCCWRPKFIHQFRFTISGWPGQTVLIQTSTNLAFVAASPDQLLAERPDVFRTRRRELRPPYYRARFVQ